MRPTTKSINWILELLPQAPIRLEEAIRGLEPTQLYLRTEEEPWSVGDVLAHLRACADVWGTSIIAMIREENPARRYVSPRSLMKKPTYGEAMFEEALASFVQERQKLVETLINLDEVGWERSGIFTGTSPRQRNQTVFSYARRIVHHEQPHLEQIEMLLQSLMG